MLKKIAIFFLLLSVTLLGEGWTKKAGSGYYALDFRYLSGSKYHDASAENVEIDGVTDIAFNLYSEYGITDNLTFRLNFPFYKILDNKKECKDENCKNNDNSGIGDLDIGLRYKIGRIGNSTFAVGLTLGVPLNEDYIYASTEKMPLGDGEFNQIISIEAGHSLYPLPAYLSGSIKLNNRNEGYSDQFYAGVESGYNASNKILLNLRINYLKSLNNGDKKVFEDLIPIHANNQEYLALKIGAFYNFYKNYGFAMTADLGLYAKNILSAPVFSVGFYIK